MNVEDKHGFNCYSKGCDATTCKIESLLPLALTCCVGVFITCEYAVSLDEHEIMTQHDEHL